MASIWKSFLAAGLLDGGVATAAGAGVTVLAGALATAEVFASASGPGRAVVLAPSIAVAAARDGEGVCVAVDDSAWDVLEAAAAEGDPELVG